MDIKTHKDYEKEVVRLSDTVSYLENVIYTFGQNRVKFKEEIQEAYAHMDPTESSHSYTTIMMNTQFLDSLEKNFDLLLRSRKKPYFARIDVKQSDKSQVEALYIGKVSLYEVDMETPLVVDWRAPIASVYYDGRLGEAVYQVEGVEQKVDLSLKRQYTIENGELKDYVDVDISTSDVFLQATLGAHAGEKLKDIVSTIQAEQNAIIRADINKPLVVQGVAGSGKTTIALHRIAYLIYTYASTFKPENFMILAPNSLFLDYISQVLPELGADKARQTTYTDFMMDVLGKRHKMTSHNHKLLSLLSSKRRSAIQDKTELIRRSSAFKNSMHMKKMIETFVHHKTIGLLPKEDFKLGETVLLSNKRIRDLFFDKFAYLPLFKRVERIEKYMQKILKEQLGGIIERAESHYDRQINAIRYREPESDERRFKLIGLMDERDALLEGIRSEAKILTKAYIKRIEKKTLLGYYHELMDDADRMARYSEFCTDADVYHFIAEESKVHGAMGQIELEDLAPLVFMQKFFFGTGEDLKVDYVVVDEAQDFSAFQFFVLKDLLKTERFTIMGDLSQGIHGYRALQDWQELSTHVFPARMSYLTLEQSYRTTIEIMELANHVLGQMSPAPAVFAKPVVRHGDRPRVRILETRVEIIQHVVQAIASLKGEGFTTIAIIGKTPHESQVIQKELSAASSFEIGLMDDHAEHYNNDIVVIPAHLSKGLEFDAVIVVAIEETYVVETLDIKLLYVAMTRPLHRLTVFCQKGTIPLVEGCEWSEAEQVH